MLIENKRHLFSPEKLLHFPLSRKERKSVEKEAKRKSDLSMFSSRK